MICLQCGTGTGRRDSDRRGVTEGAMSSAENAAAAWDSRLMSSPPSSALPFGTQLRSPGKREKSATPDAVVAKQNPITYLRNIGLQGEIGRILLIGSQRIGLAALDAANRARRPLQPLICTVQLRLRLVTGRQQLRIKITQHTRGINLAIFFSALSHLYPLVPILGQVSYAPWGDSQ